MAVIKCKMCGGDLHITEGSTVCECEYCGSRQTIPTADNEKKLTLFTRASRLLRNCEFDKASGVFESIVADFPEEAEAYWGLILCKYGIEYVDDPATGKKIPTCHRSSFESVEDDSNFEQACENADAIARRLYREEARQIETLRKQILEVSGKEEPYDIFISYKELDENGARTIDSVIAQDIYKALTTEGYRVFFSRISLEGKLGIEYEPYIFAALNSAKVMLVVGTDYEYFNAVWVKNEWSRFLKLISDGQQKILIPVYKDMDPYDMPKELRNLAAQNMGKIGAMQDLLHGVEKMIPLKKADKYPQAGPQQTVIQGGGPNVPALLRRGNMALEVGDWDVAVKCFDQLLSIDADCTEAYLGLAMARANAFNKENYGLRYIAQYPLLKADKNAIVAQRMDPSLSEWFSELDEKGEEILRQKREAEAERKRVEEFNRQEKQKMEALKRQEELERAAQKQQEEEKKAHEKKKQWEEIGRFMRSFNSFLDSGDLHIVGLRSDGTVLAVGDNSNHQCDVKSWRDIVAVAAGVYHTVGLKSDGTVVATGGYTHAQWNVSKWNNIVSISAGGEQTVGLKNDGTVLAVGKNKDGECNVSSWTNIIAISAGGHHTVGLRSDGSVLAVGRNEEGQCNVSTWKNIIAIAAGNYLTVALKNDGTVYATGRQNKSDGFKSTWMYHSKKPLRKSESSLWENIEVIAGGSFVLGIDANGKIYQEGYETRIDRMIYLDSSNTSQWKDLLTVSAKGANFVVGLKKDGRVLTLAGDRFDYHQGIRYIQSLHLDTSGWKLFDNANNLEEERKVAREAAETKRKADEAKRQSTIHRLEKEQEMLTTELKNLRGLFYGKRRKEIEERLAKIVSELKNLQ